MIVNKAPIERSKKFEYIFKDEDGTESIWKYDLDKTTNGPISVEYKYPPHYIKGVEKKSKQIAAGKSNKLAELHDILSELDEKRKKSKIKKKVEPKQETVIKGKKGFW
jgi:hypothetical protein